MPAARLASTVLTSNAVGWPPLSSWPQVLGYTQLTSSRLPLLFPLEMLHGVCFSAMWIANVDRLRKLTPHGWPATMLALFSACYSQLGQGLGTVCGGYLFQNWGAIPMFRVAASIPAGLLVAHGVALAIRCRRSMPEAETKSDEVEGEALLVGSDEVV